MCSGYHICSPLKYRGMIEPHKQLNMVGQEWFIHIAANWGMVSALKVVIYAFSKNEREGKTLGYLTIQQQLANFVFLIMSGKWSLAKLVDANCLLVRHVDANFGIL